MLDEGHLGQVLSTTRNLRKLKWDWYFRRDLQDEYVTDIIDLDQIAAGLSHVQNFLTDLTLTAGSYLSESAPNTRSSDLGGRSRLLANSTCCKI